MQAQRSLAAARGAAGERATPPPSGARDYAAYRRTLTKLARRPSLPEAGGEAVPTPATAGPAELPVLFETDERTRGEREGGSEGGRGKQVSTF